MTRRPWKDISILLAISALAIASRGFAQQSNGLTDSLRAEPDAGRSASTTQQYQRDPDASTAARPQAPAATRTPNDLGASADAHWTPSRLGRAEQISIAILAGGGLLLSLAAVGFVWWSRSRLSKASATVLLPTRPAVPDQPDGVEEQGTPPKRRAA